MIENVKTGYQTLLLQKMVTWLPGLMPYLEANEVDKFVASDLRAVKEMNSPVFASRKPPVWCRLNSQFGAPLSKSHCHTDTSVGTAGDQSVSELFLDGCYQILTNIELSTLEQHDRGL